MSEVQNAPKSAPRSYRGASSEARRSERRQKLLEAAKEVFGTRGFHSAKVKMICEAAGLTERYFYESFASSEELFIAMHRQTSSYIIDRLEAASAGHGQDKTGAMLDAYYADIAADPVKARLFAVDAGHISLEAKEVCAEWRSAFGRLLIAHLDRSHSEVSPLLLSGVIRGLLGIGVDWMDTGFVSPREEVTQAGVALTLALRR